MKSLFFGLLFARLAAFETKFPTSAIEVKTSIIPIQLWSQHSYSSIYKIVDCSKIPDLETVYFAEGSGFLPVPSLKTKKEYGKPDSCVMIFKDSHTFDFQIYWSSSELILYFLDLVNNFIAMKYCKPFAITVDSFSMKMYMKTFVFTDIDKLEKHEKACPDEKKFTSEMATSFLNSFIAKNILLKESDLARLSGLGADISGYPKDKICDYQEIYKKSLRSTDCFEEDKAKQQNKLSFDLKQIYGQPLFYIILNKSKTQVIYSRDDANIVIYVCKRTDNIDYCRNYSGKEFINGKEVFYFDKSERYDVDIQDSYSKEYDKGDKIINTFQLFVTVIDDKKSPGIIMDSVSCYTNLDFKKNFEDDDIIICQVDYKTLTIGTAKDFETSSRTLLIGSENPRILSGKAVIQVPASRLKNTFTACQKPGTKVFTISNRSNKFVAITETKEGQNLPTLVSLSSISSTHKDTLVFTKRCSNEEKFSYFLFKNKYDTFAHKQKGYFFRSDIVLKHETDVTKPVEMYCAYTDGQNNLLMRYKVDDDVKKNLVLNFNLKKEGDENPERYSIIYLSKTEKVDPGFDVSSFSWPDPSEEVVFVSILKNTAGNNFSVQAVVYKKKELFEIQFEKGKEMIYNTLPTDFMYNKANSAMSSDYSTYPFSVYDAVYLSETEIVYQVKIAGLSNCNAVLKVEKETQVRIYCEVCLWSCPPVKIEESKLTREGLKRVVSQAKPQAPPPQNRVLV